MELKDLMNNEAFMDLLMQKVVEEVVRRLKNRPKTALVCFSGAAIGFMEAMASLKKLVADGWELKVFLSDGALNVLNSDYIKKELQLDVLYDESSKVPQKQLYADVDTIIIASTTVNTAAKLANGICDNEMLTLLNHGLMAGTPMVCAVNGACPDNATRAKLGMGNSSEGYRELLKNNLRALSSFGMKMVNAEDLYDACMGKAAAKAKAESCALPEAAPVVQNDPFKPDDGMIAKRIISRGDILKHRGSSCVKVPQNAIITEYAKEAIAEFGLKIEKVL